MAELLQKILQPECLRGLRCVYDTPLTVHKVQTKQSEKLVVLFDILLICHEEEIVLCLLTVIILDN